MDTLKSECSSLIETDWPFINCEHRPTMESLFQWFRDLLPDDSDWQLVAVDNGKRLSGLFD